MFALSLEHKGFHKYMHEKKLDTSTHKKKYFEWKISEFFLLLKLIWLLCSYNFYLNLILKSFLIMKLRFLNFKLNYELIFKKVPFLL